MKMPANSSELTTDFSRPNTVEALRHFDPELVLVFNRQHQCFQVMRKRKVARRFHSPSMGGDLVYLDDDLIWVYEWENDSLLKRDDPNPLIACLIEGDLLRNPNLARDRERELEADKIRRRALIKENYRHATKANWPQLQRAFAMLRDRPAFVR